MKNISIWNEYHNKKEYPKLMKDIETDILIIGGGITGINTFHTLKENNLNVVLVERNKICNSVTSRSTGKLSFLQNNLIDKIRENCGDKKASLYLKSQIDAINGVVNTINKYKIDCDLEKVDSICYTNDINEINKLKDFRKFLNKNNINTYECNNNLIRNKYMFKVKNTYIFNPVKYCYNLISKYNKDIYENTCIKRIEKANNYNNCYTDNNVIKTKWVILACHYPYFIIPYLFPLKSSLEKSYISASKYKGNKLSLISYDNPFVSIRTYKDYLIYLSNTHYINESVCDRENFNELIKKVNDINLKPEYLWSNIDIITSDGMPYIGILKEKMLISTGYNTWGLSTSFLASSILKNIILKKKNKYIKLFSPKRKTINKGIINNAFKSIQGLIKGYTYINNKEGDNINKICPHMGCKLIYNEIEETWDCPCHGSRFNKNGKVIDSPANKDITKKK